MEDEIDRDLDVPVYEQVADILRRDILSGAIPARRAVPSIRTLCERYGIAKATAMKAIGVLDGEGLIRMVPGRGWFVRER
jgi:GntR family transcriptional regulator